MIDGLSRYTLMILCSSLLINIIQMLLPNGNNRKYVLFVTSLIVIIIFIEPIISFLNKDFDITSVLEVNEQMYIDLENEGYEEHYKNKLVNTYKENIKIDIITRLENMGYKTEFIECEYDDVTLEPKGIKLKLTSDDGTVQPVRIEVSTGMKSGDSNMTFMENLEVINMLKQNYGFEVVEIN